METVSPFEEKKLIVCAQIILLYTLDHLILSKIKINHITWFTPNPCGILDNDYQAPIRIVQNSIFRNLMIICLRVVFFDPG